MSIVPLIQAGKKTQDTLFEESLMEKNVKLKRVLSDGIQFSADQVRSQIPSSFNRPSACSIECYTVFLSDISCPSNEWFHSNTYCICPCPFIITRVSSSSSPQPLPTRRLQTAETPILRELETLLFAHYLQMKLLQEMHAAWFGRSNLATHLRALLFDKSLRNKLARRFVRFHWLRTS